MTFAAVGAETTRAFLELGVDLLILAALAWLAGKLRISPIPLYLLGGLFASAGGPLALNVSGEFASLAAEIGVLLLLFTLGLEYTPTELTSALGRGALGGIFDIVANFLPGLAAGMLLGWSPVAAVLLGGVTYISSSGVIAKLVGDLDRIGNRETPHILTLLVFEDLVMAVYLPVVSVLLIGSSVAQGMRDVGIALAVVFTILAVLSRWAAPVSELLHNRSGTVADEVVLLSVFGSVLLVGGLVQQVDVSAAVGAFLVGVAISGPAQHRAAAVIGPLRDLFAAIFFFAFALGIDAGELPPVLPAAAALAVVGILTKFATGWFTAKRGGIGRHGRWRAGTTLVARGEFSIVIAGLGTTAGIEADLPAVAAAYVLILAVAGPLLARADRIPAWLSFGDARGEPGGNRTARSP
ncbi:MAG: cation:proton antiporter [Microthrixaceae bacterium]